MDIEGKWQTELKKMDMVDERGANELVVRRGPEQTYQTWSKSCKFCLRSRLLHALDLG